MYYCTYKVYFYLQTHVSIQYCWDEIFTQYCIAYISPPVNILHTNRGYVFCLLQFAVIPARIYNVISERYKHTPYTGLVVHPPYHVNPCTRVCYLEYNVTYGNQHYVCTYLKLPEQTRLYVCCCFIVAYHQQKMYTHRKGTRCYNKRIRLPYAVLRMIQETQCYWGVSRYYGVY